MKKKYKISENIDYNQIQEFVSDYSIAINKYSASDAFTIEIIFNPNIDQDTGEITETEKGRIDPIFLSYTILFLKNFPKSNFSFTYQYIGNLDKDKVQNRLRSLKYQLEHIRFILNLKENQIQLFFRDSSQNPSKINYLFSYKKKAFYKNDTKRKYLNNQRIKGLENYIIKNNQKPDLNYTYKIESQEITFLRNKDENENYHLKQSEKFTPPIVIENENKNSIDKCFDYLKISKGLKPIYNKYKKNIVEIINYWGFEEEDRYSEKVESYLKKLNIEQLSFIECTFYLLLINKETYLPLSGTGVNKDERVKRKEQNKSRFENYISYVKDITRGLKELATNIEEHSGHYGVITARVFDKATLIKLKGKKSSEAIFLNSEFNSEYISPKLEKKQFFLDINVIDFGKKSISDKYIENLRDNKNEALITGITDEELNNDIEVIENDFKYKDFFVIGEKYFQLEHQQNKLISRYGLHHFTHIIKNELNGFIKTSSQGEGHVFGIKDGEKYFASRGTTYNCIIPLKINFEKDKEKKDKEKIRFQNADNINTFINLDKYESINIDSKNKVGDNKIPIYKFPGNNQLDELEKTIKSKVEKGENIKNLYIYHINHILESSEKHKTDCILLIDSSKLSIPDESNWIRLLSSLNKMFKDIIIYDNEPKEFLRIKYLRKGLEYVIKHNKDVDEKFYKNFNFWFEDSRVLFYSKKERNEETKNDFRYGASILGGTNIKQYNYINKSIWKHHYSFKASDGFFANDKNELEEPDNSVYGNHLFNNKQLKYFELLIKIEEDNKTKSSLLEKSIQYSLNTEYKNKEKTNNRGYKISNTHFRLGSKIHISTFYYAKRLFHNSFFTTPLAYLLANDIFKKLKDDENYSLIGYDKYSDFLLSSIRNLLEKKITEQNKYNKIEENKELDISINHCTISKDGILSRNPEDLNTNTIIIVPIASTFSTSVKIKKDIDGIVGRYNDRKNENVKTLLSKLLSNNKTDINTSLLKEKKYEAFIEELKNKFKSNDEKIKTYIKKIESEVNLIKKEQVSNLFLNIVLVGHKKEKEKNKFEYFDDAHIDIKTFDKGIINKFKWEEINPYKKEVLVKSYEPKRTELEPQKYYIPLYTEWKKAETCDLCFPAKLREERCLIETGKASVTPQLIFGLPKTKKPNKLGKNKLDYKGALLYGNLYRNNSKYLYYIKTGTVINLEIENKKKNKDSIEYWIKNNLKNRLRKSIDGFSNKKVVIVTPASASKSNFLDLINEHLFNYTANCVFISLEEDYIENAESLYSDALEGAEVVIYVDDILLTIKAFLDVNYIVKYIRKKQETGDGIDFCISLINRMTYDSEDNLLLKLEPIREKGDLKVSDRLLYFTKQNNPPIEEPNNEFPLDKERKRYKTLSNISSLDSVRQEFYNNRIGINPVNLADLSNKKYDSHNIDDDSDYYSNRKLHQLLVLDAFYSLFDNEFEKFNESNENHYESISDLSTEIGGKLKKEIGAHKEIVNQYENNLPFVLIKIMCNSPLVYYRTIRENALKWVIAELEEQLKKINKFDENEMCDKFKEFFILENNFSEFHNLKFLLKRSVQLKSNYIISDTFFKSAKILINTLHKYAKNFKPLNEKKELSPELFNKRFPEDKTSKKLIIYLVSLVQELVLNHETKSIKLEKNIDKSIKNEKVISDELRTENGTFLHYLRLLKLENTEIAHKFWEQIKKEEKRKGLEKIEEIILEEDYSEHPKYELLKENLLPNKSIKEFQSFINIKTAIHNFKILKKEENINSFVQRYFLKNTNIILGEDTIEDSFFIVNYKGKKEQIKKDDLFEFKNNDTNKSIIDEYEKSLTKKMFEGIYAESNGSSSQLSNFEIFTGQDYDKLLFRKDILLEKDIKDTFEYKCIQNKTKSVLFIRISDFDSDKKNSDSLNLYTQAVFVFFLNTKGKVPEEKLRLLLLLRKSISNFLKNDISANTFLELIKLKEKDRLIENNTHYLSKFFRFINTNTKLLLHYDIYLKECELTEDVIKPIGTIEAEINIVVDALATQLDSIDDDKLDDKPEEYTLGQIKERIDLILKSDLEKRFVANCFTINFPDDLEQTFKIPLVIIDVILTQILINLKRYTHPINKQVDITYKVDSESSFNYLILTNKMDKNRVALSKSNNRKKGGQELCDKIIRRLYSISPNSSTNKYLEFGELNKDYYRVKLKI